MSATDIPHGQHGMTDEELAVELFAARFGRKDTRSSLGYLAANPGVKEDWLDVARHARELLTTPALPAEPPPGFVRATVLAATGEATTDPFYAAESRDEVEDVAIDNGLVPYRLSRAVVDLPLLAAPAEIVGRVEE